MLRLKNSGGSKTDGEHGDIVLLAEGLRGGSDLCGGTAADGAGTFEPEELASRVARFENAIGEEGEAVLGLKVEDGLGVLRRAGDAEREAGFNGDLGAVPVGARWPALEKASSPLGYMRTQRQVTKPVSWDSSNCWFRAVRSAAGERRCWLGCGWRR